MAIQTCRVTVNHIQKELRSHGTPEFPVGFYSDILPNDHIPCHWHEQLEFGVLEKGCGYIIVNSQKFLIKKGEGFFVNSEVLHSMQCEQGNEFIIHSIVFMPELICSPGSIFMRRYIEPFIKNQEIPWIHFDSSDKWKEKVIDRLNSIWKSAVDEEFGFEFHIRNLLSDILLDITDNMSKSTVRATDKMIRTERRMKLMLGFISEHMSEEVKMEDIAKSAMISKSECMRCFHENIGVSPIQYMKQLRIDTASAMLRQTEKPVNEIATECGFGDMSYFAKTFRQSKGVTPSEYREA